MAVVSIRNSTIVHHEIENIGFPMDKWSVDLCPVPLVRELSRNFALAASIVPLGSLSKMNNKFPQNLLIEEKKDFWEPKGSPDPSKFVLVTFGSLAKLARKEASFLTPFRSILCLKSFFRYF